MNDNWEDFALLALFGFIAYGIGFLAGFIRGVLRTLERHTDGQD